jgi:hypothetical protein
MQYVTVTVRDHGDPLPRRNTPSPNVPAKQCIAVLAVALVTLTTTVGCAARSSQQAAPDNPVTTLPIPPGIPPFPLPSDIPPVPLPSDVPNVQLPNDVPDVQLPSAIPRVELPADIPPVQLPADIPAIHFP